MRLRLNGLGPPFLDRFAAVSNRFSGSWCRLLESWGQDGEGGEKTGKERRKAGEKWPKESGSNDGLTANAENCWHPWKNAAQVSAMIVCVLRDFGVGHGLLQRVLDVLQELRPRALLPDANSNGLRQTGGSAVR